MRARERNDARLTGYPQYIMHVFPMRSSSRSVVSRPYGPSPVAVLREAVAKTHITTALIYGVLSFAASD
jgi:hypothetical protein